MLDQTAKERIDTVIRNIFSGQNACGTLRHAVEDGKGDYFYNAVAPIIEVYSTEYAYLLKDRDALSRRVDDMRFALETIAQNIASPQLKKISIEAIRSALPGRI